MFPTIEIRVCLKCNKKMRAIKNDFLQRKHCKKCHFEIMKEWEYQQFIKGLEEMEIHL